MSATASPLNVAILIFDEVEVLDFCGPFEVFSVAGRNLEPRPFQVYTCAAGAGPIRTVGGMSVNPRYVFGEADCPPPQILIIPGGWGTRQLLTEPMVIEWIRQTAASAELVLSVCTGALLLAKAGLLEGLRATTHQGALALLAELAPQTVVESDCRFVDNGKVVTSAGISAGIDMSLHVVARLIGKEPALETARYMEYDWRPMEVTEG